MLKKGYSLIQFSSANDVVMMGQRPASRLPGSFEILPNSPGKFDADFTSTFEGG